MYVLYHTKSMQKKTYFPLLKKKKPTYESVNIAFKSSSEILQPNGPGDS